MDKHTKKVRILSDLIYNALIAACSVTAAFIILWIYYFIATRFNPPYMLDILYSFRPINDGINDHVAYAFTVLFTLSSLLFVSFLLAQYVKKSEKHSLPWLLAASIGIVYGVAMLGDMKDQFVYTLNDFFVVVLLVQAVIIIAGYFAYWAKLSTKST